MTFDTNLAIENQELKEEIERLNRSIDDLDCDLNWVISILQDIEKEYSYVTHANNKHLHRIKNRLKQFKIWLKEFENPKECIGEYIDTMTDKEIREMLIDIRKKYPKV